MYPRWKDAEEYRGSGYKYLGILEVDGIKHEEMKDQIKKEYIIRVRNILMPKLNEGNIRAISKSSFHFKIWSRNHKLELRWN